MGLGGGGRGGQRCFRAEDGGPLLKARSVWRGLAKSAALEKELEAVPMTSPPRAAEEEKRGEKKKEKKKKKRKTVISLKITFVWGLVLGEKVRRWALGA